jgi:phosphoribosyl 1,2-cyclic phosphodiesterase
MSDLTVRFWGTRGSIPTPGHMTEKYGGNTTCLELRYEDTIVVFDAGSGIRELGTSWLAEFKGAPINAAICFTHLHWDHIQGFPFFSAAYMPQNSFTIFGEEKATGGVRELLSGQMTGDYFPIEISAMNAKLTFEAITEEFNYGPLKIKTIRLPHPGGSLGFRVEVENNVFVLATDSELDSIALNQDELAENPLAARKFPPEMIEFFQGANPIVIDCQYTDEVYQQRKGWGHNSIACIVDLACQVTPDMLALFHHDPQSHDAMVAEMAEEASQRLFEQDERVLTFAAREGLQMKVRKPKPPPAI